MGLIIIFMNVSCHKELMIYLLEIFRLDKSRIDCFLYSGRDSYSEERWSVSLKEMIGHRQFFKKTNGQAYFKFFIED